MKWTVVFLMMILSGCNLSSKFQPVPNAYLLWTKPGSTELDVKKALMECGWPSPFPSGSGSDVAHMNRNDKALANLCMKNSGFIYHDPFKTNSSYCKTFPDLPACQPGAEISKPSQERRLNSERCKIIRDHDYCLAHSDYPDMCIHDDDFVLYPECFP